MNGVRSRELKPILRQYAGKMPRYRRTHGLARNLLKLRPALWTFTSVKGVTPTNNHAERSLRGAVIYRKLSLGSEAVGKRPVGPLPVVGVVGEAAGRRRPVSPGGGEPVLVELEEVVGGGDHPPLGPDGGAASE